MKTVTTTDDLQQKYKYTLSEPIGKNFDPEFKPELTPKEMLELGVFGGLYLADCKNEFPADWFENAKITSGDVTVESNHDAKLNFFGVKASQPLKTWQEKGWIFPDDPRGWFQWYCRYFMGRRIPEEDARQIKRWKAIKRHIRQIQKNCMPGDINCRRKQKQAVLHWAYDSRKI